MTNLQDLQNVFRREISQVIEGLYAARELLLYYEGLMAGDENIITFFPVSRKLLNITDDLKALRSNLPFPNLEEVQQSASNYKHLLNVLPTTFVRVLSAVDEASRKLTLLDHSTSKFPRCDLPASCDTDALFSRVFGQLAVIKDSLQLLYDAEPQVFDGMKDEGEGS